MSSKNQDLVIPFVGLKEGIHEFKFEITEAFFKQFEYSIIQQADLKIDLVFEKKKTMFNLNFKTKGKIYTDCDRCGDPLTLKVKGDEDLIVKFGDDNYSETDEIKIIPENEYELHLSEIIYEFAHLLLPSKKTHKKKSDCNPDIIEQLEKLNVKRETESTDPRWAALSKLK